MTQNDDGEKFDQLKVAMTVLGITPDIQEDMFKVLAAIMRNGNTLFKTDGKEGSVVQNSESMKLINNFSLIYIIKTTTKLPNCWELTHKS